MANRWRIGRKVGRTIYRQLGPEPSDDDPLIGVMDTSELAGQAVAAANVSFVATEKIADAIEDEAARIRREDWPGKVGIGYVNGFEDAAQVAREYGRMHAEDDGNG